MQGSKGKCGVIECCRDCVPPRRYPGCGANCQEYKDEKARYNAEKERRQEAARRERAISGYFINKAQRMKYLHNK